HEFEDDSGHVGEHVLDGIGEPANAFVAEEVGEAGDGGECCHDKTKAECPVRCNRNPGIASRVENVENERQDEAHDGKRNEHWMNRVIGDLRGALRMTAARSFICPFLFLLLPNVWLSS